MMHIRVQEVNAWFEDTKLLLPALDTELEAQVAVQVFSAIGAVYDTTSWTDETTTPSLVRTIEAMLYAAWIYDRAYGDDNDEQNTYSQLLRSKAEALIQGIVGGVVVLPDTPELSGGTLDQPVFFPNDASSAQCPTADRPSDGPPSFSMGAVF